MTEGSLRRRPTQLDRGERELGFTLIELLIVIVVLGVLSAVAVVALSSVTSQGAVAACNSDARTVNIAMTAYNAQTGGTPVVSRAALIGPYLQSFPSSSYYTISIVNGIEMVSTPSSPTAVAYIGAATNPCKTAGASGGTTVPSSTATTTVAPTATAISPTSGSSAGGTSVTITGTGFTTGATVNFVNESGGAAGTPTTAAASVVVNSATSITAVSPATTLGSTYFVTVTTPTGTSANPPVFIYTAPSYSTWPLSESSGTTANDTSGNSHNGTYGSSGITYGVAGPYPSQTSRAVTFDGTSGAVSDSVGVAVTATSAQSEEVWFNTTTTSGGVLITSYSSPAITGGGADRLTYMNTSGQVVFGIYNGATQTISSPRSYNDGTWHLVDAVFSPTAGTSPAGLSLYIDGALVAANPTYTTAAGFTSYTRLASGQITGWPNTSGTLPSYWQGSEAFASIYRYALTATQVAADYAAAEGS